MNKALKLHQKLRGKIEIKPKIKVSKRNLHLIYTPGVADVAREVSKNPKRVFEYTGRGNNVAIITDGSRTLGAGNTIPEASLPVLEGKAMLAKSLAGINAYPICLKTKNKKEIVKTIEILSPNFSVFNLEDIQSPKCFEIMEDLEKTDLIFFNDDQQGVSIVVLAALFNGLKVAGKDIKKVKICLAGAGVAGYGVFKILNYIGFKNLVVFDVKGIIFQGRKGDNKYLREIAKFTNSKNLKKKKPIIFALSNPFPEIFPEEIEKAAKDYIFATGRSDFPNQINNLIVFPGVLRGLLETQKKLNLALEVKIAQAIASLVKNPRRNYIIPSPFDKRLVKTIVKCLK